MASTGDFINGATIYRESFSIDHVRRAEARGVTAARNGQEGRENARVLRMRLEQVLDPSEGYSRPLEHDRENTRGITQEPTGRPEL